jgi:hypothetical protein
MIPEFIWISRWLAAAAIALASLRLDAGAVDWPPMIDAHAHYSAADGAVLAPSEVIAKLDTCGVRKLVLTSSPPHLVQRLYQHAPGRIIPLLGVYDEGRGKGDWMHDATLPEKVAAWLDEGTWVGLGELHLFARDKNSPVFRQLVGLADARQLVLMLHGDAEVVDQAFVLGPGIRVLWAHLGTQPDPALLAAMLHRYPDRLWIDTSVRDERIAPNGQLLPAWRKLFEQFPDRFVVAVDTFSVNRWQRYESVVGQIREWTAPLPQPLKANLLHDNAARLFQGAGP